MKRPAALSLLSTLLLWFAAIAPLSAQPVPVDAARAVAIRHLDAMAPMKKGGVGKLHRSATTLRLLHTTPSTYLFAGDDGRYVVAAADSVLPAIVAYGRQGRSDSLPAGMRHLLTLIDRRARSAAAVLPFPADGGPAVPPLLSFVRHQKSPYNDLCPYYIDDDGQPSATRCVSGCVATALEEVLSFHRREYVLRDTLAGWTTPHYTIDPLLPGMRVDSRLIRDNYDSLGTYTAAEAEAVARLTYMLGVAVKMNWGVDASGASMRRIAEPLRRAFGLGYVHYVNAYRYAPADWAAMLRAEIRGGRPVCFAAAAQRLNAHAFVLDGLDADGLFHVNWGVDGDYDGYFRLDLLNAAEPAWDLTEQGATEGFFCLQEAVLIHPDAIDVALPDTLERTGVEVAIDSVEILEEPDFWKMTPMRLHVRNTTDRALTTPFELFTNTPADTAWFDQGDYIAYANATLPPYGRLVIPVMARYDAAGDRILRISADDEHILYEAPVSIVRTGQADLFFDEPVLEAESPTALRIVQHIRHTGTGGRAGNKVTYELFEGEPLPDHNGRAHVDYCFLQPLAEETDTVRFLGLTPGTCYTLYVRCPWTLRRVATFTMPGSPDAIAPVTDDDSRTNAPLYDLQGRRRQQPLRPGEWGIRGGSLVRGSH